MILQVILGWLTALFRFIFGGTPRQKPIAQKQPAKIEYCTSIKKIRHILTLSDDDLNTSLSEPELVPAPKQEIKTFHLFKRLAPEMRNNIWNQALADLPHRLIHLPIHAAKFPFLPRPRIPTLLHVNQEARSLALKQYTIAFRSILFPKPVYINWDKDPVHFNCLEEMNIIWESVKDYGRPRIKNIEEMKKKLKHLMLGGMYIHYFADGALPHMEALETLLLKNLYTNYQPKNSTHTRVWAYETEGIDKKIKLRFIDGAVMDAMVKGSSASA